MGHHHSMVCLCVSQDIERKILIRRHLMLFQWFLQIGSGISWRKHRNYTFVSYLFSISATSFLNITKKPTTKVLTYVKELNQTTTKQCILSNIMSHPQQFRRKLSLKVYPQQHKNTSTVILLICKKNIHYKAFKQ